ncbi:MAG: LPS export ABC transporter periplasmic protein LptC [Gammaproteobacteria bacterium]|nr:LPS export ABC transporter periplasmic protein LptC [Gammaproteobacteria bacterium]NNJ83820.1 LPS export ABC transporter periplasmic protein LptC [Gammaproteobacteria bacterium]
MIKRWILPVALLMLLIGSTWFIEKLGLNTADQNNEVMQQKPDYFIEDFTTTVMDERGLLKRRLHAKRMVHYSAVGASELEEPYLVFFAMRSPDGTQGTTSAKNPFRVHPIWHVKSEEGRVLANGETIFLMGKVHMWKNDDTGTMELDIRTRNLKILPDSNYGETNEATVISTVTSETSGVGMRAHIKPGRMELLSQVQTTYKEVRHNE